MTKWAKFFICTPTDVYLSVEYRSKPKYKLVLGQYERWGNNAYIRPSDEIIDFLSEYSIEFKFQLSASHYKTSKEYYIFVPYTYAVKFKLRFPDLCMIE
jgi:hypothetical protein